MRTDIITSRISVNYPEYLCYSGDCNYIELDVTSGGCTMVVTLDGHSQTYTSEQSYIAMDISQLLANFATAKAVNTLSVYVASASPVYSTTRTYTIYYLRGRTLTDWMHCSGRKVILPPGISSVDIPTVTGATITGGGTSVSVLTGTVAGITMTDPGPVEVTYLAKRYFGYFNDPEYDYSTIYDVEIMDCLPKDAAVMEYTDSDGCTRYIVGRVMSRETKVDIVGGVSGLSVVRNPARRLVSGMERQIEVGFDVVDKDMHLDELLFSPEIWLLQGVNLTDKLSVVPDASSLGQSMRETSEQIIKFWVQQ